MATKPTDAVVAACKLLTQRVDMLASDRSLLTDQTNRNEFLRQHIRPLIIGIQTGDTKSLRELTKGY